MTLRLRLRFPGKEVGGRWGFILKALGQERLQQAAGPKWQGVARGSEGCEPRGPGARLWRGPVDQARIGASYLRGIGNI